MCFSKRLLPLSRRSGTEGIMLPMSGALSLLGVAMPNGDSTTNFDARFALRCQSSMTGMDTCDRR